MMEVRDSGQSGAVLFFTLSDQDFIRNFEPRYVFFTVDDEISKDN